MRVKMMNSEYPEDTRLNVLESCTTGYYRMVMDEVKGVKRVNQSAEVGREARNMNKITGNANWFKPKYTICNDDNEEILENSEGTKTRRTVNTNIENTHTNTETLTKNNINDTIEAIIFVQATHKSKLQKILQLKDDEYTKMHKLAKIKFIERSGSKLIDILGSKNPWQARHCNRDCWLCEDENSRGKCRFEGATYKIRCNQCFIQGILSEYTGETSRSIYQR